MNQNKTTEISAAVADCQNRVAEMYRTGNGFPQNQEKADYWATKAKATVATIKISMIQSPVS